MIQTLLQSTRQSLDNLTPRERAGLICVIALAAMLSAFYAFEWAQDSEDRAVAAAQFAADIEATQASLSDPTYRRAIARGVGSLEEWSRSDAQSGRDEIVAEIQALADQSGLAGANVALSASSQASSPVEMVSVVLSSDFDWSSFLSLLEALETSQLSVSATSLEVTEEEGAQRLTLVLAAPLVVVEQGS